MKNYIYIDESGDIGYTEKSSKYFILTAICVTDEVVLSRIARSVHRSKLSKDKKEMLHAYRESDSIKNKILDKINGVEYKIVYVCNDKSKIKNEDLYLYSLSKMADFFLDKYTEIVLVSKRDSRKSYVEKIRKVFESKGLKIEIQLVADQQVS